VACGGVGAAVGTARRGRPPRCSRAPPVILLLPPSSRCISAGRPTGRVCLPLCRWGRPRRLVVSTPRCAHGDVPRGAAHAHGDDRSHILCGFAGLAQVAYWCPIRVNRRVHSPPTCPWHGYRLVPAWCYVVLALVVRLPRL
jgi:hypothetical protein